MADFKYKGAMFKAMVILKAMVGTTRAMVRAMADDLACDSRPARPEGSPSCPCYPGGGARSQ